MSQDIPEKDWRVWREMKQHLLRKQCEKTLSRLRDILDKPHTDAHDTYLILCKTVQEEDKIIAEMFDDHRRSTALFSILSILSHGLLTRQDLDRFSPETREKIESLDKALGERAEPNPP